VTRNFGEKKGIEVPIRGYGEYQSGLGKKSQKKVFHRKGGGKFRKIFKKKEKRLAQDSGVT